MADNERCETCRFWESNATDGSDGDGACHRYPPRMMYLPNGQNSDLNTFAWWPDAEWQAWCGEYQPKADSQGD